MGDKAPKYEVNPGLKAILAEGRTSTFSLTNLFDSQDFKRDEENDQLPNGEQGGEYADDQQFDDGQQSGDGQQSDDDQQFEDAPKSRYPKKMPDESRPDEAQKDGALERRSNRQRTEEDHSNREHLDGDHSNQLLEEDRSDRQRPGDRNHFRSEPTWENFFFGKNDERFERLKFYDSDKIEKHNKDWNRKKEQLVMVSLILSREFSICWVSVIRQTRIHSIILNSEFKI